MGGCDFEAKRFSVGQGKTTLSSAELEKRWNDHGFTGPVRREVINCPSCNELHYADEVGLDGNVFTCPTTGLRVSR